MRGFIAMAVIALTFVASFAQAQEPKIERGISIANELIQKKSDRCTGTDAQLCAKVHDDVIAFVQRATSKQLELANAEKRNDQKAIDRLLNEIVELTDASRAATNTLIQYLSKRTLAVGSKS